MTTERTFSAAEVDSAIRQLQDQGWLGHTNEQMVIAILREYLFRASPRPAEAGVQRKTRDMHTWGVDESAVDYNDPAVGNLWLIRHLVAELARLKAETQPTRYGVGSACHLCGAIHANDHDRSCPYAQPPAQTALSADDIAHGFTKET